MRFLVACAWLHAVAAIPQTVTTATGTIGGRVTDSTAAPLPGVSVVIISSSMMGERSTTTDREGRYTVSALPPGNYAVTFTLAQFATQRRERVQVGLGFTADVDVTLSPAPHDVVTVVRGAPLLDRRTTALGTTMDAAALADVPGSRSMGAILQATPAVYLGRLDVGGTGAPPASYGAYGTAGFSQPLVDGISVTGINAYGVQLDYGAFDQVAVGTGSFGPELSTPGVQLHFSIKSGGNRHHGAVYADIEPRRWQAYNVNEDQIARGAGGNDVVPAREANRTWHYHDVNADAGGFIRPDRLWWYGSVREQNHEALLVNFPVVPFQTRQVSYTGKVSAQVARNHRLVAFVQGGRSDQPTRLDPFGQGRVTNNSAIHLSVASTAKSRGSADIWKGEWNAAYGDQTFVELRAGQFLAARRELPNAGGPRTEDVDLLEVRGGGRDWETGHRRDQLTASISHSPGRHFLKIGTDVTRFLTSEAWRAGYPGDVLHVFRNRTAAAVYLLQTPSRSEHGNMSLAAFASDTWRLPRTTLTASLRFDRHRLFLPPQVHPAGRFNPEPQVFAAVDNLRTWNLLSSRAGVVFDLTDDGKTLLKLSASHYALPPGLDFGASANPNPPAWWRRYAWSDPNGTGEWEEGESLGLVEARGGERTESLVPDLKLPYIRETTAFAERELRPGVAIRSGVVWRGERQQFQRVNDNQPPDAFSVPIEIPDPGPDGRHETSDDGRPLLLWQLDPAFLGLPVRNVVQNAPHSASDYWTWETVATVRDAGRWSVTASVVHSWNREHNSSYLGQPVRQYRYSQTPNDFVNTDTNGRHVFRIWSAKVAATYFGPWDLRVTPLLRHQSGQPFGRTLTVTLNYNPNLPILTEPMGTRRMDNVTLLDVRIEKGFSVGRARRLAGFLDLFNVLNANPDQNVIWASGRFRQPLAITPPRIARIGLKAAW
jgi:hypothetical protein